MTPLLSLQLRLPGFEEELRKRALILECGGLTPLLSLQLRLPGFEEELRKRALIFGVRRLDAAMTYLTDHNSSGQRAFPIMRLVAG